MNFQEIVNKLNQLRISKDDFGCENMPNPIEEIGLWVNVESEGGGEGEGENVSRVHHFIDQDIFIRLTGYYTSYDGTEYSGEYENVSPEQEVITVYKRLN